MAGRRAGSDRPVTLVQTPDVIDPAMQRAFDVLTKAVTELQSRRLLDLFTSTESGYVPASGTDTNAVLHADGEWRTVGSGGSSGVSDVTGTAPITVSPTTGSVVVSLDDNGVTNAKLRDSSGVSIIGRAANTVGDPGDIVAGADGQILARLAGSLQWVAPSSASIPTGSGTPGRNTRWTGATALGDGAWLDDGTNVSIAGTVEMGSTLDVTGQVVIGGSDPLTNKLRVIGAGNKDTIAGEDTASGKTLTMATVSGNNFGTFDTTSGVLDAIGGYFDANASRSAGANNLRCVGVRARARGGQQNWGLWVSEGDAKLDAITNVTISNNDALVGTLQNSHAAGYSGFAYANNSGTFQGYIAYANASAVVGAGHFNFYAISGTQWRFANSVDGGTSGIHLITNATTGVAAQFSAGQSAAVSAGSTGRIRYNATSQIFQTSLNGGAYATLPQGSGTTNTVSKWTNTGVLGNSVITDDGSTVTIPIATFRVGSPVRVESTAAIPMALTQTGTAALRVVKTNTGGLRIAGGSNEILELAGVSGITTVNLGPSGSELSLTTSGHVLAGSLRQNTDNTHFAWDSGGSIRVGFTKKAGFTGKLTYGSGNTLIVAQSSAAGIEATNTFTDKFTFGSTDNTSHIDFLALGLVTSRPSTVAGIPSFRSQHTAVGNMWGFGIYDGDSSHRWYYYNGASWTEMMQIATSGNTRIGLNSTSALVTFSGDQVYALGDTLNFRHTVNADSTGYINYYGYNSGFTRFRDLSIRDGKGVEVANFAGSTKATTLQGTLSVASTSTFLDTVSIVTTNEANNLVATHTPVGYTASGQVEVIKGHATGTFDTTAIIRQSIGVSGRSSSTRSAGANELENIGVFGYAQGAQVNEGVVGNASGAADANIGVFGDASGGTLNYSGYFAQGSFVVEGAASFQSSVAIGNAAGDAHALLGTLNANSTAGSNGEVLTIVGGVPQWAVPTTGTGGSGTIGKLSKWTAATTLGDSLLSESGSMVTLAGNLTINDSLVLGNSNLDGLGLTGYYTQAWAPSAATASANALNVATTGTFNTTGGALESVSMNASTTSTRSSGANSLVNYGLKASASGAQQNIGVYATGATYGVYSNGPFYADGAATITGATSIEGNATIGNGSGDTHTLNGNLTFSNTPTAGPIKYGSLNARLYLGRQIFTASGTYTPSTGTKAVIVKMVGGGGGGGSYYVAANSTIGGGGAGGAYLEKWIDTAATVTGGSVTVGAAGSAGNNSVGGTGGDTTVVINGITYTAKGGLGGDRSVWTTGWAVGGAKQSGTGASSGSVDYFWQDAGGYALSQQSTGSVGYVAFSGKGGDSPFGRGGAPKVNAFDTRETGNAGQGYGAGGSGHIDGVASGGTVVLGGAGTAGLVIIEEYA